MVRASRGANTFGLTLGLFRNILKVSGLNPARTELFLEDARRRRNIRTLFDLVESARREVLNPEQIFPMRVVTVAVPVIHNTVREIFGNSGQLG